MNVTWIKPDDGIWYDLAKVDLTHSHFNNLEGVYIIWQCDVKIANVVKVGQGLIKDRLQSHRIDREIQSYNTEWLSVTWAAIPAASRDGVERFLGDKYTPKVADRFPNVTPIVVNLPKNE